MNEHAPRASVIEYIGLTMLGAMLIAGILANVAPGEWSAAVVRWIIEGL